MSAKVLQIVVDRVLGMLKDGIVPWRRPWKNSSSPMNIAGYPYRGINFFLLSMMGHETPVYLTFNQIRKAGGKIKSGEEKKHSPIFFWKIMQYNQDKFGNDLDDPRNIPIMRYSQVWNIAQVEGIKLPKRFLTPVERLPVLDAAEAIVNGYANAPKTVHGGDRACYSPVLDKISMPNKESFHSAEEYYSTMFHEMAHSTGHLSRLNRKEVMDGNAFGSHDYSVEELVAEMSAALMCAHSGIDNTLDNSVSYIAGWVKKLQDEPKMLMTAAARAQKAFAHIAPQLVEESSEESE